MTRNRNRNKKPVVVIDYKDTLQSLHEKLIIRDNDEDKQPANIVDELPIKQVLARL